MGNLMFLFIYLTVLKDKHRKMGANNLDFIVQPHPEPPNRWSREPQDSVVSQFLQIHVSTQQHRPVM